MTAFTVAPIGHIHSCFKEKFGIPRQPGLVRQARATLTILPAFQYQDAFRGLEAFSHIWIIFLFHHCGKGRWTPTVRPPRLGGNKRVGVFASRSGFRPNRIGQSVVRLEAIRQKKNRIELALGGVDLLDGTPVLDIKPYLPYADSIPDARSGYAETAPQPSLPVLFSEQAAGFCKSVEDRFPGLRDTIKALVALDPRPAYTPADDPRRHGMRLWDFNISFTINNGRSVVETIAPCRPRPEPAPAGAPDNTLKEPRN